MNIMDKLYLQVEDKGHVCVGLDSHLSYLPESFRKGFSTDEKAVFAFNKKIIDATADVAACFKVQIAYYEAMGLKGLQVYSDTLGYLRDKGLLTIGDVKRGDIAKTGEMYADAHFSGDFECDFITVSPFMGRDTLLPYLDYVKNKDKGLFVLVATSNPGANDIQGVGDSTGRTVSHTVADMLEELGSDVIGNSGYSPMGAVVGCTNKEQTTDIRSRLPHTFFLIPGYGAQGGTGKDMKHYLKNKNGGVVNSSRGILLAWKNNGHEDDFASAAREECIRMKEDIINAV